MKGGASFSNSSQHTTERSAEMSSGLPRGAAVPGAEGCYPRRSHGLAPYGLLTNCCPCKKLDVVSILLGKIAWKFSERLYNDFPANQNLSRGGLVGSEKRSVVFVHFRVQPSGTLLWKKLWALVCIGCFKGTPPLGGSHHRQSAALSSWHSRLRWWLYRYTLHSPRFLVTPHTDSRRPLRKTWRCQLKSALLSINTTTHKCFCVFFLKDNKGIAFFRWGRQRKIPPRGEKLGLKRAN